MRSWLNALNVPQDGAMAASSAESADAGPTEAGTAPRDSVVGLLLIGLAVVLLIAAIVNLADGSYGSVAAGAQKLLDQILLVLILVEIVHTVVLSLRAHRLLAQPFIVVGLMAVIRRILLALTPGSGTALSTTELGLLIAMVAVFITGLIAVGRFEKGGQ